MLFVLLQTCGQNTRGKQTKCNGMDSILKAPVGVPKGAQFSTLVCMTLSLLPPQPPTPYFCFVLFCVFFIIFFCVPEQFYRGKNHWIKMPIDMLEYFKSIRK